MILRAPKRAGAGFAATQTATCFGLGRLKGAPGSYASLAVLPFGVFVNYVWGWPFLAAACVVLFAAGLWSAPRYARACGKRDPGEIVIDEAAGQCAALLFAPLTWEGVLAAFVFFRLADILKPWPLRWSEKRLPLGLAVMGDDILAALWAGAGLAVLGLLL